MKKAFLLIVLLPSFLLQSQTRKLTLYTNPTCNNCKYTKYTLHKNNIAFEEYSLDEKEYGAEMLKRLKNADYTGKIYLPAIFENDTVLLHPTPEHNDSTLLFVIQQIISQKKNYETLPIENKTEIDHVINKENVDCDFEITHKYLVCTNFKDKESAETFKKELVQDGYAHADIIFYKGFFRVYVSPVFENENELELLNQLRKKYKGAYLLKTEN